MTLFLVWLTGYIASYFFVKYYFFKRANTTYVVGDRIANLFTSSLSWLVIIYTGIFHYLHKKGKIDMEKQAKW